MTEMPPENVPEMPADPFVDQNLLPMAKMAFSMFSAFLASGFSEPQAVHMVTGIISGMLKDAMPRKQG